MTLPDPIVIVGGGPAGLSCAIRLRQLGYAEPMLVLDRTDRTVEPKLCGGLLSTKAMETLQSLVPSATADIRLLDRVTAIAPLASHSTRLSWPLGTIDRCQLNRQLEATALGLNIELIKGRAATVTELNDRSIRRKVGRPLGFRQLVGADGAASLVRRSLKFPPARHFGVTREYRVASLLDDLLFEWYLAPGGFGYSWAWPISEQGSVIGSGVLGRAHPLLAHRLDQCLARFNVQPTAAAQGAAIPFDYHGSCFGNRFLIGDAAGLADDLSGEGIRAALESAIDIAERIINPAHPCPRIRRILAEKRWHRQLGRLVTRLPVVGLILLSLIPLGSRLELGRRLICRLFGHTPPRRGVFRYNG